MRLRTLLAASLFLMACGDNDNPNNSDAGIDAGSDIEYDREVSIPGQTAPVSAFYDKSGVLSLQCQTDADCLAAQGYFHAADRFFQMDLRRRFARGKLAALAGPILLDQDLESRSLLATRDGGRIEEQMWAAATPETKAAVEAYTRGVNAWIEDLRNGRNGAKLSSEYDFMIIDKTRIDDWEELDSISSFLPVMAQLTNRSNLDRRAGEAFASLPPALASDLYGMALPSNSTVLPQSSPRKLPPSSPIQNMGRWAGVLDKAEKLLGPATMPEEVGSNNWIVGPDKAGGKALMANDPHLTLSNPAIWHMVHIDSKSQGGSLHIAGASFPGMPGILFGQNEELAWGVTTTFFDQSDLYLETLNEAGDAVIFNGNEVAIEEVELEFEVSQQANATRTALYVPHHGPIVSIDREAGTAVTMRWMGQDADTDYNFLWKIWTASTVADAKEALKDVTSAGQNFVVADTAGDIGWYPYNKVPSRPWMASHPAWLPLPGDGSAEWDGFIPYENLPQATNPADGYLATANNDMTGHLFDGDPTNDGEQAVQSFVAEGYRHERIAELLAESDAHDIESMQSIQHDNQSLYGKHIVPLILSDLDSAKLSASAAKVKTALENWDFFCPTGFSNHDPENPEASSNAAEIAASQGCAAFHVVWSRLRPLTFEDELADAGANFGYLHSTMANAFLRPEVLTTSYWDNISTKAVETRAQIVVAAVEAAGEFLEEELGNNEADWRWGALHTLYLPADLFDAAGVTEFADGPYMNHGALSTVDVATSRNDIEDNYSHSAGASIRLTCEADQSVSCFFQLPGGQRHHRADDFYNSLLPGWLGRESVPLAFSIDDVVGESEDTILVTAPSL